jgi:hypothetical protein
LYLTRIQLIHAGNYTCHAQRNKDVVQTHVLTVHSKFHSISYCVSHVCLNISYKKLTDVDKVLYFVSKQYTVSCWTNVTLICVVVTQSALHLRGGTQIFPEFESSAQTRDSSGFCH